MDNSKTNCRSYRLRPRKLERWLIVLSMMLRLVLLALQLWSLINGL